MAFLYISEFERPRNQWVQTANAPPIAEQKLVNTGGSVASVAFQPTTRQIRVHTDSIVSIAFGATAPTATTSNMRMAANQTEYFSVNSNSFLAVIANT